MERFDYTRIVHDLLTADIVNLLTAIHEHKGQQNLFIESRADILDNLLEIAKIQSTEASNRIEGIFTSDRRIVEIVKEKSAPRNRNESEIAGYRDVLALIHENYDAIPLKPNLILQLHRDLYAYSPLSNGGRYKMTDNVIGETDELGNQVVRFRPLSAVETPAAMDDLCAALEGEINKGVIDPLLLLPLFILDFLCIHPFRDGNGRMSRLLTLLLLYQSGYIVGKYISIEMLIEKSKETYYEALQASSVGWHNAGNDYKPFARYTLGVVLNAYRELSKRMEYLTTGNLSKPERVAAVLRDRPGKLTMEQIQAFCPDISYSTISKTLNTLIKEGKVQKVSGGRYTQYVWKG